MGYSSSHQPLSQELLKLGRFLNFKWLYTSYNTLIKRHVCINTGASIDHDNFFGDYSSAGPGTVTGGNVRVNKLSYLAINSTVKHNILIGSNVVIGASSYVNRDCISNRVYYGIPAKEIRKRTIGENYL